MRQIIYSLMTDKTNGKLAAPFKFILYVVSLFYGAALYVRRLLYTIGIFRSEKVPMKIISVGNLTLGGTGKTPFVIALTGILSDELRKRTSILIRGYGWDEQNMLKKKLQDTPIMVGEDRAKSAHKAIRLYGSDTAVMDDGFQHWELARDLNIVLVDSRNPFGNGQLFPRGVLREPVGSIKRADIVVFTKADKKVSSLNIIKSRLESIKKELIFIDSVHKPCMVYDQRNRKELSVAMLDKKRVILLSGIGDPAYFQEMVRGLGAEVAEHIIYPDHHNYTEADMTKILRKCDERKFDFVLMTEKDEVKIKRMSLSFGRYIPMTLMIETVITSGKELLVDRLRSLYTRSAFK